MARSTRLEIEGGWYHVVNRGIERRAIYRGESDYEQFLKLIGQMTERYGIKVHGYVLMGNHYHLQIETLKANLSRAMQWLNVSYGVWYNRKYRRVGPLFQGRFKAILHDSMSHGVAINRYIHLNPVRIKRLGGHEGRGSTEGEPEKGLQRERVKALREYRWSSWGYYSGSKNKPEWMTTKVLLDQMDGNKTMGLYRKELERAAAVGESGCNWKEEIKLTVLLGGVSFVEEMKKLLKGDRIEQQGVRKSQKGSIEWEAIKESVAKAWGEDWEKLAGRYGSRAKVAALYVGRRYSDRTLRQLGEQMGGMRYPAVTMAVRRFENALQKDKLLRKRIKQVCELLLVKM